MNSSPARVALIRARHEQGWTQDQVAALCGCDRTLVSQWETGRQPIPEHALLRLAEAGIRRPLEATVEAAGGRIEWDDYPVPDEERAKPCTVRGLDAVQGATTFAAHACTAESPASAGGARVTRQELAELLSKARQERDRWCRQVALLEEQTRIIELRRTA